MDLSNAGLSRNESKVYLSILDLGSCLAGQIARKSGLHRRTVYDVTETLINKGLIGYILENNRRVFHATNPERIISLIKEKEEALNPLVEELKEKFNQKKTIQETSFYKGLDGLKSVFEEQLEEKELLILGARDNASEILNYYFKWYNKKRIKRKIKTKVIAHSRKNFKIWDAEVKYLPEKYSSPLAINIYGDKTAIILWSKKPLVIVIQNKEITEGYKKYFEVLWRIAKE